MLGRPLVWDKSRAHRQARLRRLLEKFALALTGALVLYIFLFILGHINEAMSGTRAGTGTSATASRPFSPAAAWLRRL